MKEKIREILSIQFNNYIELKEKRPGVFQLYAPLYHADGDMMDIYFVPEENDKIRICDFGLTMMRLSYTYDVDTPNKERIFNKIITESGITNENENLYIDTKPDILYPSLMQFVQTVAKIVNMRLYRREVIHSLFFEMLDEFVELKLSKFNPQKSYFPLIEHDEYEVDYCFNGRERPIYLFGVNSNDRARLATIACQKFITDKLKFRSLIVFENYENVSKKDFKRLMSASDKEFPSFDEFQNHAVEYLEREDNWDSI